jgi:hypothetical protein
MRNANCRKIRSSDFKAHHLGLHTIGLQTISNNVNEHFPGVEPAVASPPYDSSLRRRLSDFSATYRSVIELLLNGQSREAGRVLEDVPGRYTPGTIATCSHAIPLRVQFQVFQRDSFTCRYCSRRTVLPPVLRLLSVVFPEIFPHNPNWKMVACHLAFWRDTASCDHIVPIARQGSSEPDNLVTACYMCNSTKQNWSVEELGWEVMPVCTSDWDGLARSYAALYEFLRPQYPEARASYFQDWLRAVERSIHKNPAAEL